MRLLFGAAFGCVLAFGQTFEVASVMLSPPISQNDRVFLGPPRGGPGTSNPGQITWTYATLKRLLLLAYDVKNYQVSGPGWLDTERYDIAAKVPAGTTKEQVNVMWQNLLAERFGVTLHHESKEFQVEELVIGRGGHKLKESAGDTPSTEPDGRPQMEKGVLISNGVVSLIMVTPSGPHAHTMAKAQTLSALTQMLGSQIGRPVLDKTGLTGKYDFDLEFTPDLRGMPPPPPGPGGPNPAPVDNAGDPGPNLASAVQQQLGLRLVSNKAKLDVLIIDKAEKVPTEN